MSSCMLHIALAAGALNYIFHDYRPICKSLSWSGALEKLPHKQLMRVMRIHEQLCCGLHAAINTPYRKGQHAGKNSNLCTVFIFTVYF